MWIQKEDFKNKKDWFKALVEKYNFVPNDLNPKFTDFPDPFLLGDLKKSVHRIIDAIKNKEKIAIYADYDVDGTCAGALLFRFFRDIKVDAIVYQPDRFTEGYGINSEALLKLSEMGVKLVITVDCGISAKEPVDYGNSLGLDIIITDHHQVQEELPKALAIINPNSPNCTSNYKELCGTGVAFMLMVGLRKELREMGFYSNRSVYDIKQDLDLVALASIADIVPVVGVNRILLKLGMSVLESTRKPGLRSLMQIASVKPPVTTFSIGFGLAPRINAAGRFGKIQKAFELLVTEDPLQAMDLAMELDQFNKDRISIQEEMVDEVVEFFDRNPPLKIAIYASEKFNEGIVGIVASKVVEKYKVPALIFAKDHEGNWKGSGRSVKDFDLFSNLMEHKDEFLKFGGHPMAVGLGIAKEKFNEIKLALETKFKDLVFAKKEHIEFHFKIEELSEDYFRKIQMLQPFGTGFEEPRFLIERLKVSNPTLLKEKHWKFKSKGIDFIHFKGKEKFEELPQELDVIGTLDFNFWNSRYYPQVKIIDIRASES